MFKVFERLISNRKLVNQIKLRWDLMRKRFKFPFIVSRVFNTWFEIGGLVSPYKKGVVGNGQMGGVNA